MGELPLTEALFKHIASGRCVRVGNMHSAIGRASPVPGEVEARTRFKKKLLALSLEMTRNYAFATPQGNDPSSRCIVAGDYNMTS